MQPTTHPQPDHVSDAGVTTVVQPPRRITSTNLLCGERRIIIEHGRESYALILTRNDKLILTK